MTFRIRALATIAVFALACGGSEYKSGEPTSQAAFTQFALANGGFFNGSAPGGSGSGSGAGQGGLNVVGITNEIVGGSGNVDVCSLLAAFGQVAAPTAEVWLLLETAVNPNNLSLDIFDPGTTTAATGAAPASTAFLTLSTGGILILEGVPTQDVDYVLTDTSTGNFGTVAAKFQSQPSQPAAFTLIDPPDAAGTATPTPVAATPNFTWAADAGAVQYVVYCFGQDQLAGVFGGNAPTTDIPFVVRTTGTSFDLGSGAGATFTYESNPLPLTNAGGAPNWGWIAVSLDADGWQLNPAEFYFDMITQ